MNIDIEDYDDIHKIIVIGDSNTGKTSLIESYCRQKVPLVPKPTIGVEYTSQTVIIDDYKKIKIQIWDTAGQ